MRPIEQLELENNKLFRQNVENLKAEKEKTKDLEIKLKVLEEEKAEWMRKSEIREGSKEKFPDASPKMEAICED